MHWRRTWRQVLILAGISFGSLAMTLGAIEIGGRLLFTPLLLRYSEN